MSDSFDEVVLLKLWERITKLYYIKAIHIYNQILYYKTRLMIKKKQLFLFWPYNIVLNYLVQINRLDLISLIFHQQ